MVELLSLMWLFKTSQLPQSAITAQTPQAEFAAPVGDKSSFTVKFTVDLKPFTRDETIVEIPNVLKVDLRHQDPNDRNRQNYPSFKLPDGSVPVLEASIALHSIEHPNWNNMTVGFPLAMLKKPFGEHQLVVNFTGVTWRLFVDGQIVDNDFPFGFPNWSAKNSWKLNPAFVSGAEIYLPGIKPEKKQVKTVAVSPEVQYWTPPGHNSWVGDVVTAFYKGRYHVFYLFDRRHHQSKFGCGAHYFEHISTADFHTWTEHEAATPLEDQWECIGTGTPFVFEDKLCLAYGLHTTRVYPSEKTTLPAEWDFLNKSGSTGEFNRASTPGVPAGSTYSVSADGISDFHKSNILFHPCENPSIYRTPDGKLRMMANYRSNGIWESESVNSGWHCISPGFPPGGDCTFFFHWGSYDYIIGGFTSLWSKPAGALDSAYVDEVHRGMDFYDGSNVPAITEVGGGRFLMAAWIPIHGWGGNLVLRELVQFPDGRIGSKWMHETTPATVQPKTLAAKVSDTAEFPTGSRSFMLSFTVHPDASKQGRIGVELLPEKGDAAACEFQLDPSRLRAQFGSGRQNGYADSERSLREGGSPQGVGNYAIENLIGLDKPYTVRIIVKGDDKIGGSLVDAEIAGSRTMISYRSELSVKRLSLRTEGITLDNVQIAPLQH